MPSAPIKQITVLGSTGSIGASTLAVIAAHPDRYAVYALAARRSVDTLLAQCLEYEPRYAVLTEADAAARLQAALPTGHPTQVRSGTAALDDVASAAPVDAVMAAIVGAVGLPSALAAARAGKRVMLANKEALVMAGALFMSAVRDAGAELLPIDSEHNAIFQCLPVSADTRPELSQVRRVLLTASGGPFRDWDGARLYAVTPDQACAHPNWSMGRKISVDSATLMNKGLELAEACWLFGIEPGLIEVVVHPQSIVHSMVEYCDGSVLAQLGNPDMRTPIAYGLAWPERIESGVAPLDIIARGRLDFRPPDEGRFPCLRLAREAIARGGTSMVVCNAANEIAVDAFLNDHIGFMDIPRAIEAILEQVDAPEPTSLAVVEQVDAAARRAAADWLAREGAALTP